MPWKNEGEGGFELTTGAAVCSRGSGMGCGVLRPRSIGGGARGRPVSRVFSFSRGIEAAIIET